MIGSMVMVDSGRVRASVKGSRGRGGGGGRHGLPVMFWRIVADALSRRVFGEGEE